jgi:quercetin dioxygenase-like cupin family protein
MITRVARDEAALIALPGRTLYAYLRRDRQANPPFSTHVAIFPPGSRPEGHVHPTETEAVYVIRGHGRIVTPDETADLEPGVFVLIEPGTRHATESGPDEELELYCVFSPPVVLGSYEPAVDTSR